MRAARVMHQLFEVFCEHYPPTTHYTKPTAPVWIHTLVALGNLPWESRDREVLEPLLDIYYEFAYTTEKRYWGIGQYKNGDVVRSSAIGDVVVWGYELDIPIGKKLLKEVAAMSVQRDDLDQIKRYAEKLVDVLVFYELPEAGFTALYDYYLEIKPYLDEPSVGRKEAFWEHLADELNVGTSGDRDKMRSSLINFIMRLDDGEIPPQIKHQILNAPPKDNLANIITGKVTWFFRDALEDEEPEIREFFKLLLGRLLEANSFQRWLTDNIVYLGNTIYGDRLFAN